MLLRTRPRRERAPRARGLSLFTALSLTLLFTSACGAPPPPATPAGSGGNRSSGAPAGAAVAAAPGATQAGTASYYSDSLAGRPTASGEPYDPGELTAAHRTLPFGTMVEVAREDGRSVVVRINDRGPFGKKKRVLDLSRAAARAIGLDREGVAKVTLRVISVPSGR